MRPSNDMTAREALERDYSPSRFARDPAATLARQASLGRQVVTDHGAQRLAYANDPAACLDLFVPKGKGPWPLMAFIHGGYWQELDHTATNFLAGRYLARGVAFASLGYGLAPRVSIEMMVEQCRLGVQTLITRTPQLGLEPRLALGGHSAGAQLACRVALAEVATARTTISSLLLISGVYDLRPLVETYVNAPLGLDIDRARALSPRFDDLAGLPPMRIVMAERDTPAFRQQSRDFHATVQQAGGMSRLEDLAGCDHFDVLEQPDVSG